MKRTHLPGSAAAAPLFVMAWALQAVRSPFTDPLPSWNPGPSKRAIVEFVGRVTREGGPDYVAGPDRINRP